MEKQYIAIIAIVVVIVAILLAVFGLGVFNQPQNQICEIEGVTFDVPSDYHLNFNESVDLGFKFFRHDYYFGNANNEQFAFTIFGGSEVIEGNSTHIPTLVEDGGVVEGEVGPWTIVNVEHNVNHFDSVYILDYFDGMKLYRFSGDNLTMLEDLAQSFAK